MLTVAILKPKPGRSAVNIYSACKSKVRNLYSVILWDEPISKALRYGPC